MVKGGAWFSSLPPLDAQGSQPKMRREETL